MLDYDSWSIPEQINSIYRATRININFYSIGLMEESPQLIKNGLIFADLL